MRRWLRRGDRFWADRAAALAYRAELQRGGRPTDPAGQAKQLGLSVALTSPQASLRALRRRPQLPVLPYRTARDRGRSQALTTQGPAHRNSADWGGNRVRTSRAHDRRLAALKWEARAYQVGETCA
jgi:hypothetical protein